MPVTEFAILKLRPGCPRLDLLETLVQCQALQNRWMQRNQPDSLEPHVSLSSMYTELPGTESAAPPSLLVTAPWHSPAAHGEWLQSRENRSCNQKLSEYVASAYDSPLLLHLLPAGSQPQMRSAFLSQGTFNVCHITAHAHQRHSLQDVYQSLEDELLGPEAQQNIWAGWSVENADDEADHDLIVFWTDNVLDARLQTLMTISDRTVQYRFKHVA